jgi:hypothetical protein
MPMSEQAGSSGRRTEGRPVRFEATLHPRPGVAEVVRVDDLDVDRVPDPEGGVRVLVDVAECVRLLDGGFEVRLQRAVPIQPIDPRLVSSEEDTRSWIEQRVREAGGPV